MIYLGERAVYLAFIWVTIQTFYAVPVYAWRGALGGVSVFGVASCAAFSLAAIIIGYRYRTVFINAVAEAARRVSDVRAASFWIVVLGGGLAIRIAWLFLFPAEPQLSDHATYLSLARQVATGEPYHIAGTDAFWPPGYPMFLAPLMALFDRSSIAMVLGNLILFVAAVFLAYSLGRTLGGESIGRLAAVLVALWPNHIASVSLAKKEIAQLVFWTLALLAYLEALRATTSRQRGLWSLFAGASLGAASLIQPSTMLAASVFAAYEVLSRHGRAAIPRLLLLSIGMVLVIAPWTARNYAVFGAFVPISTNGGHGFYGANNARATGGYLPGYEKDLEGGLGELGTAKVGYAKAKAWIHDNPGDFLKLSWSKQILLLGDDSDSVAWAMGGMKGNGGKPYLAMKAIASLFWVTLMFLAFVHLTQLLRTGAPSSEALLLMLPLLYIYAIDSIAESGSRHHIGVMIPIMLLAIGACRLPFKGEPAK